MRRIHPKMLEEILLRSPTSSRRNSRASALLIVLSFVREDVPWLYEIGMEVYRAMLTSDRAMVTTAHKQFQATMELMMHGPWSHDLFREDEESFMMSRYLPDMIDRLVSEYLASLPIRRRLVTASQQPDDDGQA